MKNLLLVMPKFFGYENAIKAKMEELGWHVHLHSDRPSESTFVKAAIRINYRLIAPLVSSYYDEILLSYPEGFFQKIVIIRGEAVSLAWLARAKEKHPQAEQILYFWDSIAYNKNALKIYHQFDRVLSFDPDDCKTYGFDYRPLFASDVYFNADSSNKVYDLTFIGTVYADRHKVLNQLIDQASSNGLTMYLHPYYPSKLVARLRSLIDPSFGRFYRKYVTHEKLGQQQTAAIIAQSKVIIDVNRSRQKGLTMRTLEAMAAKAKLVSTNEVLKSSNEYSPDIHLIVDRHRPELDKWFVTSSSFDASELQHFTLKSWAIGLVGLPE